MDSVSAKDLDIYFLPFPASGHLTSLVEIARIFACHGVKVTIITTPSNALTFQNSIDHDTKLGHIIKTHILPFPYAQVGLPKGIESYNSVISGEVAAKIHQGIEMLQQPIEQLLLETRPDCIVSDMHFPWTVDLAKRLGIPRLMYHARGFFTLCAEYSIKNHAPHENVTSDSEPFLLPGLPDNIKMSRSQLPTYITTPNVYTPLINSYLESDQTSYGVLVNSFYELESGYADHYRNVLGIKAWHIGPVTLTIEDKTSKAERGNKFGVDEHYCLNWLNSKKPNSVLYICFGSLCSFPATQLFEIASSLEACGHDFIWVVVKKDEEEKGWLPEGFEERTQEKGLIIKGWAPQVSILNHPATGAFLTHCGTNSVLEGVTAGLPMITWPITADQYFSERLVVDVLKIGVEVGVKNWISWSEEGKELVKREKIERAFNKLMGSGGGEEEDVKEMRIRAREMGEMAKRAIKEGGSSYVDWIALIDELKLCKLKKLSE